MKFSLFKTLATAARGLITRKPTRKPVESSVIASVGYLDGTLEIEFKNGRVYAYHDVSERTYERLMSAPSLGAYFNAQIRNEYEYHQIR